MKTNGELLNVFMKKEPDVKVTDVYDDNNELLVRCLRNKRADFYFIRKIDGSIREYFTGSDAPRIAKIMQANKRINIQNEE